MFSILQILARSLAVALASLAVVLGSGSPAFATVNAATLTSSDATQNAVCPATVHFSGTVTGTPNSSFQYWFAVVTNSQQTLTPPVSAVFNASGSLPVSLALPVTASTSPSGTNLVELGAAPMFGVGTAALSQKVNYTVTCQAAPPPIPAPSGLTNTLDSKVCGQHVFPLLCVGMASSALTLVWNWSGDSGTPSVDGFNVYVAGQAGRPGIVSHSTAGGGATGTLLNYNGPFTGKCYFVTAYKGNLESAASNKFCVTGDGVIMPLALKLADRATLGFNHEARGLNETLITVGIGCGQGSDPCAGWSHWENGSAPFEVYDDQWYRGYLGYDTAAIKSTKNITSAKLNLVIDNGDNTNCLGGIGIAKAQWIGSKNPVDGDYSDNLSPSINGRAVTIDVTNVVKDWASGARPDFGFIFKGTQENNSAHENASCFIEFNPSAVLEIRHF